MELQILPTDFGRKFDIHLTEISGGGYFSAVVEKGEIRWVDSATLGENKLPLLSLTTDQMRLLRRALDEKFGTVVSNSLVSINITDS